MLSAPIAATTAVVLFPARPAAFLIATVGAKATWPERLLVGWIGPRGVVAAAIAGIAGERLTAAGYADAKLVLPMVFAVIAATVLLHGLSLGPLARRLGLVSGGRGGLPIVGASAFATALGEALRGVGIPVIIVDRSHTALLQARLAGLVTLRAEILSTIGEEVADLRDIEHVLAATSDDAYNALVCSRFAQIAFANDSGRHATAREWRGKIVASVELNHARLGELTEAGAAIVVETASEGGSLPRDVDRRSWPIAAVTSTGRLLFISPEQPAEPAEGDLVLRLYQPILARSPTSTVEIGLGTREVTPSDIGLAATNGSDPTSDHARVRHIAETLPKALISGSETEQAEDDCRPKLAHGNHLRFQPVPSTFQSSARSC